LGITSRFSSDGWDIEISSQGFSSVGEHAKEPRMGGDLGIIIDIANEDQRVIKGMLVQAKRTTEIPDDPLDLPSLRQQLQQCCDVTRESYAWIYTPFGVVTVREGEAPITVEDQVEDALKCTRGDREPRAVATAADRDYTVEVLASGPGSDDD
jgi:hypothetical protein